MSAATDTFTAFVDVLAEALDDHEASGEDLALRVHLSRFHFDRGSSRRRPVSRRPRSVGARCLSALRINS